VRVRLEPSPNALQVLLRDGWSLLLASDSLRAAEELTTAVVNVICAARSGTAPCSKQGWYGRPAGRHRPVR
jgi:hypothetical protein